MTKFIIFITGSLLLANMVGGQGFSAAEQQFILSGDTSKALRVIPLAEPAGAKALRSLSAAISWQDPLLPVLKSRMLKAVLDSNNRGVGIAAPQVGINRNLIWVQRYDKPGQPFQFFINPRIIWGSDLLTRGGEGDLSFEGYGEVLRHYLIGISYTDEKSGAQQEEILEGFTAVIFQHETDHLFGKLFTDRIKEQQATKYRSFESPRSSGFYSRVSLD